MSRFNPYQAGTGQQKALWLILFSLGLVVGATVVAPDPDVSRSDVPELVESPADPVAGAAGVYQMPVTAVPALQMSPSGRTYIDRHFQNRLHLLVKHQADLFRHIRPMPVDRLTCLHTSLPDPRLVVFS